MMRFPIYMMIAASALASGAAVAAPVAALSDVAGTVLVDQGRGFVRVSTDSDLVAGTRVMLSRDGKGVLAYAGPRGCKIKLSANTITTVSSVDDCHPAAQVAGQAGETGGAAAGGGTTAGGAAAVGSTAAISTTTAVVVGVVAVTLVTALANDDEPASP